MFNTVLLLLTGLSLASAIGIEVLFPELKQYYYVVKTNVSTGTADGGSYWTLEGRLCLHVYDNFTRIRLQLDDLNTSVFSQEGGYSSYQSEKAATHLKLPWELEYGEDGLIKWIYVGEEPIWSTNIKRALSVNFQIKSRRGASVHVEPCLYESCTMVYSAKDGLVKKYTTASRKSGLGGFTWSSVPWSTDYNGYVLDNTETVERTYDLGSSGLNNLVMNSNLQYKVDTHILSVTSELSMYYDSDKPGESVDKLNVSKTTLQYTKDFTEPSNGIKPAKQVELRTRTYEILMKIAMKGIDADNIVRNGSFIHSLDFIELLDTVSRLTYFTLTKLFEDLVLGTSYDTETARNIFLEVLPHARSDACARFIKHLVLEEKNKLEDATIISLIRKLPFNVANLSQNLLEELETFTKLSLDFPQSIRHAGILSFAVLASKTAEASKTKQDYFDNIVVKYFRMYNDCPQYLDRMVWLQGLCSLGNSAESYIRTIYVDKTRNRRERLWASLACAQNTINPDEYRSRASVLESYLPILTDESEHIQLRIAALHSILSVNIGANDFLFIHNYITASNCNTLKRFWYSTVKSLESNKYFSEYHSASGVDLMMETEDNWENSLTIYSNCLVFGLDSFVLTRTLHLDGLSYYVPFVSKHVKNPDSTYWATNNYIVSSEVDLGAWVQLMSVGGEPIPTFAGMRVSTPGRRPYQAAVYMITEGVSSNLFNKFFKHKSSKLHLEKIVHIDEKLKDKLKSQEEVHIDIVMKINDKTVFATHVNQSRFESWNGHDVFKSIMEFLRFGSHINQQLVYYPVQLDVHEHSALGTPIRLQSSVVAFTSVRGNLTAPPDPKEDLDWENDLHIRYQGTTVTSLSTFAPLLASEHIIRLQRSFVAHLPIKFNVTMEQSSKSMALTWLNPFAQRAGMAMHSRVQVEINSPKRHDVYTITKQSSDIEDNGIFFDCERKISGGEVLEKYLLSKFVSYDILPTHQSILNNIERFITSPACGVIVPPSRPTQGDDELIKVKFSAGNMSWTRVDRIELNFRFLLSYYSLVEQNEGIYLKMDSSTMMKSDGRNVTVDWNLYVEQPYLQDSNNRFLKLCLSLQDISHASETQDIAAHPASYEGRTVIAFSTSAEYQDCKELDGNSKVTMVYTGAPKNVNGDIERYIEVNILGEKLHRFGVLSHSDFGDTPVSQLLGSFDKDTINSTAVIKEKHGVASISVNKGAEIQFEVENFGWMMDSLTSMQLMKRFGIYRECRLQKSTIETLSGNVEQLRTLQHPSRLVLGDCSETSSFAIVRFQSDELAVYSGPETRTYSVEPNVHFVSLGERYLSSESGVIVYMMLNETVILLPSPYLPHVCGECVDSYYN